MSDHLIVTTDIPFGAVYAYRVGDTITPEAVKENGWEDFVASPKTKAAQEAQGASADTAPSGKDK